MKKKILYTIVLMFILTLSIIIPNIITNSRYLANIEMESDVPIYFNISNEDVLIGNLLDEQEGQNEISNIIVQNIIEKKNEIQNNVDTTEYNNEVLENETNLNCANEMLKSNIIDDENTVIEPNEVDQPVVGPSDNSEIDVPIEGR